MIKKFLSINHRISKILYELSITRKDKKVELTTDKKGNKYYILMIKGRAYKKTTEELLKQNF